MFKALTLLNETTARFAAKDIARWDTSANYILTIYVMQIASLKFYVLMCV